MKNTLTMKPHPAKFVRLYALDCADIPAELFNVTNEKPDLSDFPLPLPSKKSDYTCFVKGGDGAYWYGAANGLTRYNPDESDIEYAVEFMAGERYLADNRIKALLASENGVWALNEKGATHVEIKQITAAEKADILLDETVKYVYRHKMVSQKELAVRGDLSSALKSGHSDNDGTFTAGFAVGEMFRYAVLSREKGENAPETVKARKIATESCEACLLLMYIHGRGDGFVARTYLAPDEPVPDDGLFFRREGGRGVCLDTSAARERNLVGYKCEGSAPIPERLARLFKDEGYSDEGLVYKGDTSSDEITHHYLQMYFAHRILGPADPELDGIIKDAVTALTNHIIDNGFRLIDATGEPTTWARWDEEYFNSPFGWVDACLNAGELLMYIKVALDICGNVEKWQKTYDELVAKGYAELTAQHFDRLYQATLSMNCDYFEDIMYGDHMLALCSFWLLCDLEKDEKLLATYRAAFKSWRTSMALEHNPAYDFPFAHECPGEEINMRRIEKWFERFNVSRLASGVSTVGRHDIPVVPLRAGYKRTGFLLTPDEAFISKYDRDPLEYKDEDSCGGKVVESCYVYTFAYWTGRYYGFID